MRVRFCVQLAKCAPAKVGTCIDISSEGGSSGGDPANLLQSGAKAPVSKYLKCASITDSGKVIGVYGGSDLPNAICRGSSDCSGSDEACPSASDPGMNADINPNVVVRSTCLIVLARLC